MNTILRRPQKSAGFSLLEVMIAVVVLATGLLALAALQGSLTRSSAEAKVRGRVAAMLSARMDTLRSLGYDAAPLTPASTTFTCASGNPAWLCTARDEANLGALTVTQDIQIWSSGLNGSSFTNVAPSNPGVDPEFKRVLLAASWTDAGNNTHSLGMTSELSALSLRSSLLPTPDPDSSSNVGPVVREDDPAGDGVIPIALGNGNTSAASNPTPELQGSKNNQTIVGTRFDVLTYQPAGVNSIIRKRFENTIVRCSCKFGPDPADPDPTGTPPVVYIYKTAQWPAIWTGDRYEVYKTDPVSAAPGEAISAQPKSGVDQSPLCTECCRDHHDGLTSGVAKFDPERTAAQSYYNANSAGVLTIVPNTTNSDFVQACRMIRVDGLWRTAADTYSRQFGLLQTGAEPPAVTAALAAKTGLPTKAASDAYTAFVKDYLKQYDGTFATSPPITAQSKFDAVAALKDTPPLVTIPVKSISVTPTDWRFLHARGLYVDYLEEKARKKLQDVLADTSAQGRCPSTTVDKADCILPYLPFTTINVTELAAWKASNTSVLQVNSRKLLNILNTTPNQPSGSATLGSANGDSDNVAEIGMSNSGLAATDDNVITTAVDQEGDQALGSDKQPFHVGDTVATGDGFNVLLQGLLGQNTTIIPTINSTDVGTCSKPASLAYHCATNSTLPATGTLLFSNYQKKLTAYPQTVTCAGVDHTEPGPALENWQVTAVKVCNNDGSGCGASIIPLSISPDDSGMSSESTSVTLSIPKAPQWPNSPASPPASDQMVQVTFAYQSTRTGATYTCNYNGGGRYQSVTFQSPPYPWGP